MGARATWYHGQRFPWRRRAILGRGSRKSLESLVTWGGLKSARRGRFARSAGLACWGVVARPATAPQRMGNGAEFKRSGKSGTMGNRYKVRGYLRLCIRARRGVEARPCTCPTAHTKAIYDPGNRGPRRPRDHKIRIPPVLVVSRRIASVHIGARTRHALATPHGFCKGSTHRQCSLYVQYRCDRVRHGDC